MEIIKRKTETDKETIGTGGNGNAIQISYNNFGHISLRFFDKNTNNEDVLIVLDFKESMALIDFIHRSILR